MSMTGNSGFSTMVVFVTIIDFGSQSRSFSSRMSSLASLASLGTCRAVTGTTTAAPAKAAAVTSSILAASESPRVLESHLVTCEMVIRRGAPGVQELAAGTCAGGSRPKVVKAAKTAKTTTHPKWRSCPLLDAWRNAT